MPASRCASASARSLSASRASASSALLPLGAHRGDEQRRSAPPARRTPARAAGRGRARRRRTVPCRSRCRRPRWWRRRAPRRPRPPGGSASPRARSAGRSGYASVTLSCSTTSITATSSAGEHARLARSGRVRPRRRGARREDQQRRRDQQHAGQVAEPPHAPERPQVVGVGDAGREQRRGADRRVERGADRRAEDRERDHVAHAAAAPGRSPRARAAAAAEHGTRARCRSRSLPRHRPRCRRSRSTGTPPRRSPAPRAARTRSPPPAPTPLGGHTAETMSWPAANDSPSFATAKYASPTKPNSATRAAPGRPLIKRSSVIPNAAGPQSVTVTGRHECWRDKTHSCPTPGDHFAAGVVLHTGPRIYRLDTGIVAAPISVLWGRASRWRDVRLAVASVQRPTSVIEGLATMYLTDLELLAWR